MGFYHPTFLLGLIPYRKVWGFISIKACRGLILVFTDIIVYNRIYNLYL